MSDARVENLFNNGTGFLSYSLYNSQQDSENNNPGTAGEENDFKISIITVSYSYYIT